MTKCRVRLLNNQAEGTDHLVEEETVWNAEVIKHRGRIFYFEGINQYGDRVYRDVVDTNFRLDPDDNIAEIP